MPLQTGNLAYLKVATPVVAPATPTYEKAGKMDSLTINLNLAEIEAGHFDDGGWTPYLTGKQDATIDFSCKIDTDASTGMLDAGQEILLEAYFDKTEILVKFAQRTGTGIREWSSTALVTSLVSDNPDGDVAMYTGTLRLTTKPTEGTQA